MEHSVRQFQPDDAACVDALWRSAFEGFFEDFPEAEDAIALGPARLAAMGWSLLVAESSRFAGCRGAVRSWDDDGVAWFDMLVAAEPFAGRDLVREVRRLAQERGLRSLRTCIPADAVLQVYFARLGFREVAVAPNGRRTLERRLPLLTVRAQRREDAEAIAALAGIEAWPFEQGIRPGWFVLADGEHVAGVVAVRESGFGEASVHTLVFEPGYQGRGLEPWMLSRAGGWAATNGYHTISVGADLVRACPERTLEDHGWFRDGDRFVLRDPSVPGEG